MAEHQGEPAFLLSVLCLEDSCITINLPSTWYDYLDIHNVMFEQTNGIICIHEFYL